MRSAKALFLPLLLVLLIVAAGAVAAGHDPSPSARPWPTGQRLIDALIARYGYRFDATYDQAYATFGATDPSTGAIEDGAVLSVFGPLEAPAHALVVLSGGAIDPLGGEWRHVARLLAEVAPEVGAMAVGQMLADAIARTDGREDALRHVERLEMPVVGGDVVVAYATGRAVPVGTDAGWAVPSTYAIIELVPSGAAPVVPAQPRPTPFRAGTPQPSPTADPTRAPAAGPRLPAGSLDGGWSVDPGLGTFDFGAGDFSGSWAGYRFQARGATGAVGYTWVGRTPDVTGSFAIAGTAVTDLRVEVDLRTLESADPVADAAVRGALDADEHPMGTFVLTSPLDLGSLPAAGEDVELRLAGDLSIRGVARPAVVEAHAAVHGDVIAAVASHTVAWADFGVEPPATGQSGSASPYLTLETQLFFTRDR